MDTREPGTGVPVLGMRVGVFNWRLKRARERAGLTMQQLAERVGHKHVTTLYRIQALKEQPSEELADRIAIALETPVDELFPDLINQLTAKVSVVEVPFSAEMVRRLADDPTDQAARRMVFQNALQRVLPSLTTGERVVVEMRFGEDMKRSAIAERLGLTRQRVFELEQQAMRKFRRPSAAHQGLRDAMEAL